MPKMRLTKQAVDELPFPEVSGTRINYIDSECSALYLRVTTTAKTFYYVTYNAAAKKREWVKIGRPEDGHTPNSAREYCRKVARGEISLTEPAVNVDEPSTLSLVPEADPEAAPSPSGKTCRELAKDYLEQYAVNKKDGGKSDRRFLEIDFLPVFGDQDAASVKRSELQKLFQDKANGDPDLGKKAAPVAANRLRAVVSKMFSWGMPTLDDGIQVSPVMGTHRRREQARDRVLSHDELRLVWRKLSRFESDLIRGAVKMLIITLQRRSEVALMEWKEIDWKHRIWTIPKEKSKNGHSQTVPLSKLAIMELERMKPLTGHAPYVFWSNKRNNAKVLQAGVIHPDWITHAIAELRARDEELKVLERFTPHDFRRTAATNIGELMESREAVKRLLNHVEGGATSIYDRATYTGLKRKALNLWADRLTKIIRGEHIPIADLDEAA